VSDEAAYLAGTKTFEFNSRIYGAKSVKNGLLKAQQDKCAFCESKVRHVAYGDVEHFRPKAGFRQRAEDDLGRPGYYWLAYEWTNLYFACQICNQKFKVNLFPLTDPAARAISHRDDLSREEPLLIDPEGDDPEEHIGFRKEYAYPISGSPKARTTIQALGLNREELVERRRDRMAFLDLARIVAGLDIPESEDARAELDAAMLSSAEYASMTKAWLRDTEET